jgi:hypothetical protein
LVRTVFQCILFQTAGRLSRIHGSVCAWWCARAGWGFITNLGRFGHGESRRLCSTTSSHSSSLVWRMWPRGLLLYLCPYNHILAGCRWCWYISQIPTLCPSAGALWDQSQLRLQALAHRTHPVQGFSEITVSLFLCSKAFGDQDVDATCYGIASLTAVTAFGWSKIFGNR